MYKYVNGKTLSITKIFIIAPPDIKEVSIPFTMTKDPWTEDLADVNSPKYEAAKNLVLDQLNLRNASDLVPGVTVIAVDVTFRPSTTTAVDTNARFLCIITNTCLIDAIAIAVVAVVVLVYEILPQDFINNIEIIDLEPVIDIGTQFVDAIIDVGKDWDLIADDPGTRNFRLFINALQWSRVYGSTITFLKHVPIMPFSHFSPP